MLTKLVCPKCTDIKEFFAVFGPYKPKSPFRRPWCWSFWIFIPKSSLANCHFFLFQLMSNFQLSFFISISHLSSFSQRKYFSTTPNLILRNFTLYAAISKYFYAEVIFVTFILPVSFDFLQYWMDQIWYFWTPGNFNFNSVSVLFLLISMNLIFKFWKKSNFLLKSAERE